MKKAMLLIGLIILVMVVFFTALGFLLDIYDNLSEGSQYPIIISVPAGDAFKPEYRSFHETRLQLNADHTARDISSLNLSFGNIEEGFWSGNAKGIITVDFRKGPLSEDIYYFREGYMYRNMNAARAKSSDGKKAISQQLGWK